MVFLRLIVKHFLSLSLCHRQTLSPRKQSEIIYAPSPDIKGVLANKVIWLNWLEMSWTASHGGQALNDILIAPMGALCEDPVLTSKCDWFLVLFALPVVSLASLLRAEHSPLSCSQVVSSIQQIFIQHLLCARPSLVQVKGTEQWGRTLKSLPEKKAELFMQANIVDVTTLSFQNVLLKFVIFLRGSEMLFNV